MNKHIESIKNALPKTIDDKAVLILEELLRSIKSGKEPQFALCVIEGKHEDDEGISVDVSQVIYNLCSEDLGYCVHDMFSKHPELYFILPHLFESQIGTDDV